jgi:hypothetical protein
MLGSKIVTGHILKTLKAFVQLCKTQSILRTAGPTCSAIWTQFPGPADGINSEQAPPGQRVNKQGRRIHMDGD